MGAWGNWSLSSFVSCLWAISSEADVGPSMYSIVTSRLCPQKSSRECGDEVDRLTVKTSEVVGPTVSEKGGALERSHLRS